MEKLFGPDCPWYNLHINFPPNVDWNEEKLCSFIVTPFNAWTNLAYILFGFLMLKKTKGSENKLLRFFGKASIIVGSGSFIYHISLNYFTQIVDFFAMYVFAMLMLMANLKRLNKWAEGPRGMQHYWLSVVGLTVVTAITVLWHFPIQLFILLLIIAIMVTELIQKTANRGYFWMSIFSLVIAITFSALDLRHTFAPENHLLQGHGIWHIFSALALYFAFLHTQKAVQK